MKLSNCLRLAALLAFILLDESNLATAEFTTLFFFKMLEGTSDNKALAICNPTLEMIELDDYQVEFYFNGNTSPGTTIGLDTFSLNPGQVWVLADNGAVAAINADQTSSSNFYNGNDAIILRQISSGQVVDAFGTIGFDPGTEWAYGGQNGLAVRMATGEPDTNPDDTFVIQDQYTVSAVTGSTDLSGFKENCGLFQLSQSPSISPTLSLSPSETPTRLPSHVPTDIPSQVPTQVPSQAPIEGPCCAITCNTSTLTSGFCSYQVDLECDDEENWSGELCLRCTADGSFFFAANNGLSTPLISTSGAVCAIPTGQVLAGLEDFEVSCKDKKGNQATLTVTDPSARSKSGSKSGKKSKKSRKLDENMVSLNRGLREKSPKGKGGGKGKSSNTVQNMCFVSVPQEPSQCLG